jgi:hypothetical protein
MASRSDQWNGLTQAGESFTYSTAGGSYNFTDAANDKFIYPRRQVRYINDQGERVVKDLKRGYIRNLTSAENKVGVPTSKCQFQFNPQYLVQSVSQNTQILNFLQQEPGQYAQPIPGNVSFNFDLFFDRSMELNAAAMDNTSYNPKDPWTSSPGHVGVLHDIAAFYEVIGVGLSEKMGKYAEFNLEKRITAEINAQSIADDEDSTAEVDPDTQFSDAMEAANNFLKYNVGNTAFLLPLPVRIVFSGLYIVEGLVKDVTVTFTKFTQNMVPMQATLNVLFEAKYIGFAKKDTFFTQVLEEWESQELRDPFDIDGTPEEIEEAYDAANADLSQAVMMVVKQEDSDGDDYAYVHHWPGRPIYAEGPLDYSDSHTQNVQKGPALSSLVSNQNAFGLYTDNDSKVENYQLFLKVGFPDALHDSALENLALNKNKNVSLQVSAQVDLWRWEQSVIVEDAVKEAWNDIKNIVNGDDRARPGIATGPYTPNTRSKGRSFFSKLWDYGGPKVRKAVDNGNNERAFASVHRVWSGTLNESNVQTEVKDALRNKVDSNVIIADATALKNLFNAGLTAKVSINKGEFGTYDRSIDRTTVSEPDLEPDKFPEYETDEGSTFYLGLEYELEVLLTIDSVELPVQRVIDFMIVPVTGVGETMHILSNNDFDGQYNSVKAVNLDWQSAKDDVLGAIDDGADDDTNSNSGSSSGQDINQYDDGGNVLTAQDDGFIAVW